MSQFSLYALDKISALQPHGASTNGEPTRALCLPKLAVPDGSSNSVSNLWLMTCFDRPPGNAMEINLSPIQPGQGSGDRIEALRQVWEQLGMNLNGVHLWRENTTGFLAMPSADPRDYPQPRVPGGLEVEREDLARIDEVDGGEVIASVRGPAPEPERRTTAFGYRQPKDNPGGDENSEDCWVEYWGLLAGYEAPNGHFEQQVSGFSGTPPYTNLSEFFTFMQDKVNNEGARLLISTVGAYGPLQNKANTRQPEASQGDADSTKGHAETY